MIPATSFAGKEVALFGLGTSGISAAQALVAGGATVFAWDDTAGAVLNAAQAGIPTRDLRELDWSRVAALVLSPGVPLTHPEPHWSVKLASANGVEVIGDIELFCRERAKLAPNAPLIAVTGTNGKSTTTALIGHLLAKAGVDVQTGGNIGTAILSLQPPSEGRVHLMEVSSYQIDLAPSLRPTVGVLLNVSPDHIERHGSFEHYAEVKARLVEAAETAIIGEDDKTSSGIADRLEAAGHRVVRISSCTRLRDGVFGEDGGIVEATDGRYRPVASLLGIGSLRGEHNAQNAAAAIAACFALGLTRRSIVAGLKSFPGLPHRMEEVGRLGKVLFVNDSKATNADAAAKALECFDRIYWIAGGRAKAGGISSLDRFFPRIAKAYLIGEAADEFAATLEGHAPMVRSGTLAAALEAAAADAAKDEAAEPVVLLSPAAASFDQFRNFEHRGDSFRELVQARGGVRKTTEAA
jgi:UDP-N-acetylmuramoylalanine--D-glutamate ligase